MAHEYKSISEAYFDFHIRCLKTETEFMIKYDVNYQQLLYLKFLFFEQFETMYKYLGFLSGTIKPKERFNVKDINSLYEKGIVKNRWIKAKDIMPDVNAIDESFVEEVAIAFGIRPDFVTKQKEEVVKLNSFIDTAGEELFSMYPTKNSSGMLLVACNSFTYNNIEYSGKEDVKKLYAELIEFDWTKHKEVLNKIKQDDGVVCNVKITSFVKDKMWEYVKETNWNDEV